MGVCVFLADLNMECNPSDHPRASTIFLSKCQTDGKLVYASVNDTNNTLTMR